MGTVRTFSEAQSPTTLMLSPSSPQKSHRSSSLESSLPLSPPSSLSGRVESTESKLSPAAEKVIQLFQDHSNGERPKGQWVRLPLSPKEYNTVREQLKDTDLGGYVDDKIRFDYVPHASELIIRLPTELHNTLTMRVLREIEDQISRAATRDEEDPCIKSFLSTVKQWSGNIFGSDSSGHQRCPDGYLKCRKSKLPGVIIETAYSQTAKNLDKLADDYIKTSKGNIQMIICLNLAYRPNNSNPVDRISVWEAKIEDKVFKSKRTFDEVFRGPDRSSANLMIPIGNLAHENMLIRRYGIPKTSFQKNVVTFPLSRIAAMLDELEADSSSVDPLVELPSDVEVELRSTSSEEQTDSETERQDLRRDQKAEAKAEMEDSDYEDR